ncbi:Cytochrome c oxidase assembly protein cox11, mitochondrial [Collariella sp. IMI 366227]|nr:Cytochrome c oxidase assembly protein cox11, mitochondrial [Collariella sp. IMI 366227]
MLVSANPYPRKKVAIVGGGIAGLGALWVMNRSPHDAYIYDADSRLGGHTCTVEFVKGKYKTMVDMGFMIMNSETYPNFISFLKMLGVKTAPVPMSFSVSRDQGCFEWAGSSLDTVFCQRKSLFSPRMWRMLFDIIRFNNFAPDVLETDRPTEETIGEYLKRERYSEAFRDDYLIPMTAAIWSISPDKCTLNFPAVTLIRFLQNHHLLSTLAKRPEWLTIVDSSKTYIDKFMRGFPPNHIRLNTTVTSLTNDSDGRVRVHTANGTSDIFDHVILATHADQALSIIRASATPAELSILSHFHTTPNTAILHSDTSLLPKSPKALSSWNYLTTTTTRKFASHPTPTATTLQANICITYSMNHLQSIPHPFGPVLVTLNPCTPSPAHYPSPVHLPTPRVHVRSGQGTAKAGRDPEQEGISYAGAWTGYGFHEDGFYTISIILGTVAFSYGSVPMYKMICQTTGWGGQPVRAHGTYSDSDPDLTTKLEPVTDAKRIRVTFSASVSDVLPWKFTPQQREVRVLPGETALAFYTATNLSSKDIIGVATYSVTPAQTAPYFSKIQCFCFEEQRLQAGETVDMPVFFYLDPDLLKDLNMKGVETVTLNYTFFSKS